MRQRTQSKHSSVIDFYNNIGTGYRTSEKGTLLYFLFFIFGTLLYFFVFHISTIIF